MELVAIGVTSAAILAADHKYLLLCIAVAWWGVAQVGSKRPAGPCMSGIV